MATEVVMPQAGQGLETGLVRQWLKREGDLVRKGEPIVEIETEKLSLEVEAPSDGILRKILVAEGTEVPILSVLAIIGSPDEAIE
jgi:pyruvate/2-oxoglutarate dehydrogenase complex dihydrolipoamide acyltransferase (E2) component